MFGKQKTLSGEEEGVQVGLKRHYLVSGQTPSGQDSFLASTCALQALHIPPVSVQAGQTFLSAQAAVFSAQALSAGQAFASAGGLDMAYAETVSTVAAMAIMNFFMKPPGCLGVEWYLFMPF
jgi:hypothetical protein